MSEDTGHPLPPYLSHHLHLTSTVPSLLPSSTRRDCTRGIFEVSLQSQFLNTGENCQEVGFLCIEEAVTVIISAGVADVVAVGVAADVACPFTAPRPLATLIVGVGGRAGG